MAASAIWLFALEVALEFVILFIDGVVTVVVAVFIPEGIGCSFGFDWKNKNKNMTMMITMWVRPICGCTPNLSKC